jgi:hypothetical protein
MTKYSDIKPGDTIQGAAGKVKVTGVENGPNGILIFNGTRPDTGNPASTWGRADAEVRGQR